MQEDKLNNINTIYKNEYVILQAVPYASYQQILQPSYAEYTHFLLAKDGERSVEGLQHCSCQVRQPVSWDILCERESY